MSDSPEPDPNADLLAHLAAKAQRRGARDRHLFGEPEPAPDAQGEYVRGPVDDDEEAA